MRRLGPFTMLAGLIALACLTRGARGQEAPASPQASPSSPVLLDRVVVRWHAPESGGVRRPQFIFERELAFEARIEALADPDAEPGLYRDRHIRAAIERHIAETLLASQPISPAPTSSEIAKRAEAARVSLEQRARGRARLLAAAAAEGMSSDEIDALLRRQARASLYLDRMVAPMLEPSEFELRAELRSGATPFKDQRYEDVAPALKRWVVANRLFEALDAYYQSARARVSVSIVPVR